MPTQEQINAANVELDIANDNYARLADQYNRYQNVFQSYANASPETQEEAKGLMQDALAKYEQLKLDMYAAEDRIQQAQGAVNRLNAEVQAAQEAAAVVQQPKVKRREISNPNNSFWGEWRVTLDNWTIMSPDWWTFVFPDWSIWFWLERGYPNNSFWWEWWKTTSNWTKISPDWWTVVYPDWSIWFGVEWWKSWIYDMVGWMSTKSWPKMWYITSNIKPSNNVPQLRWVDPDFVYTPWMSLRWVPTRLWYWTLTPKGYAGTNWRATHQLKTWGNSTGTLI